MQEQEYEVVIREILERKVSVDQHIIICHFQKNK